MIFFPGFTNFYQQMELSRFFNTENIGVIMIFGGISIAQAVIIYLLYKRYKQTIITYENIDLELAGIRESTNQLWREVDKVKENFKNLLTQIRERSPVVMEPQYLNNETGNKPTNTYNSMATMSRVNSITSDSEYLSANDEFLIS